MIETRNYEKLWHFWLDEACYEIARGTRYLAIPSEVSKEVWETEIQSDVERLQQVHGVLLRGLLYEDVYEIQVAKYGWVFEVLDLARGYGLHEHAVTGVLLGYDGSSIDTFLKGLENSK